MIVQDEFFLLVGLEQLFPQRDELFSNNIHPWIIELIIVASETFRPHTGGGGIFQERDLILAILGIDADAYAGGDDEFIAINFNRLDNRLFDFFNLQDNIVRLIQVRQN